MKDRKFNIYYDFDTILYRKIKGLQKDYISVEYQNNGRWKDFKNITEFKGNKKIKIEGWLGDINKERKKKKLSPFLLKDFKVENRSKVISSDDKAKESLAKYVDDLKKSEWIENFKLIIGGPKNFRYDVYADYKANRGPKPLRFSTIKDWFCKEYEDLIIISDGCEADDYLSIAAWHHWEKDKTENNTFCAGHIDKDEDQFPGWHYNFDKDKFYFIDEFTAHYNLCVQCIIGDKSTDNIPSVPKANDCIQNRYPIGIGGIGPKKVQKILHGCDTIEALYREVEEVYKCYYKDEYKEPLTTTYRLVKLLEKKGEFNLEFPFQL